MLTFAIVIGFLTATLSILIKVIGFPDQIRKNYKRKSTEGVSATVYILSFITYLLWTIHGAIQMEWVIILGQGLGIFKKGVILYQIFLYRQK